MPQQPSLQRKTTTKPVERPVAPKDAVSGSDNRYRIGTAGRPYRTRRRRDAEGAGQTAIRHRAAIGNGAKGLPHTPLKVTATQIEGYGEIGSCAGEILLQFDLSSFQHGA